MKLIKKSTRRSKSVLGRKPERVFHVKEVRFIEPYPGAGKERVEILHAVDDFCYNPKFNNYG